MINVSTFQIIVFVFRKFDIENVVVHLTRDLVAKFDVDDFDFYDFDFNDFDFDDFDFNDFDFNDNDFIELFVDCIFVIIVSLVANRFVCDCFDRYIFLHIQNKTKRRYESRNRMLKVNFCEILKSFSV
jgi:hypothetical protein